MNPAARTHPAWRTDEFWIAPATPALSGDVHKPTSTKLTRSVQRLRAIARTPAVRLNTEARVVSVARERLTTILDGGLRGLGDGPLDVQQEDALAAAICAAGHDLGRARASAARTTSVSALLLSAALYASFAIWPFVVLRERWGISVDRASGIVVASMASLGLLFMPTALLKRNAAPRAGRWSSPTVVYATLVVATAGGLASLIVSLTISYPGSVAAVAIAAPAPWCILSLLAPLVATADVFWLSVHWPADPRSAAQLVLLHSAATMRSLGAKDRAGAPTDQERRKQVAVLLERAAGQIERTGTFAPWIGPSFGHCVKTTLASRSKAVAAGLRRLQIEALWPDGEGPDIVACLEQSLIDSCFDCWSTLESVPTPARPRMIRLIGLRALLSTTLLTTAWIVPEAFGHILSDTASNTLRLILIITAITSALAPRNTVATAVEITRTAVEITRTLGEIRTRGGA
jgi:hypothetical protein